MRVDLPLPRPHLGEKKNSHRQKDFPLPCREYNTRLQRCYQRVSNMPPHKKTDPYSYPLTVTLPQTIGERLDRVFPPGSQKRKAINLTELLRDTVTGVLLTLCEEQEKKDRHTALVVLPRLPLCGPHQPLQPQQPKQRRKKAYFQSRSCRRDGKEVNKPLRVRVPRAIWMGRQE